MSLGTGPSWSRVRGVGVHPDGRRVRFSGPVPVRCMVTVVPGPEGKERVTCVSILEWGEVFVSGNTDGQVVPYTGSQRRPVRTSRSPRTGTLCFHDRTPRWDRGHGGCDILPWTETKKDSDSMPPISTGLKPRLITKVFFSSTSLSFRSFVITTKVHRYGDVSCRWTKRTHVDPKVFPVRRDQNFLLTPWDHLGPSFP